MIARFRGRRPALVPVAAIVLLAALEAGTGSLSGSILQQPGRKWIPVSTGVTARLRGVSAVSDRVIWASGSNGTIIRTEDGGATWTPLAVGDAEKLDFRDIDAIDARTAYALSIGPGDASRIYKTSDGGATWRLQFRNSDPNAFFDAMAFRDAGTGFALSDSVGGQLVVIRTTDGGATWTRVEGLPPAREGEGAYAASGTNVAVIDEHVWLATTASRVIRSTDGGRTWAAAVTPLPTGASAGIFSIAFRDARHGLIVGGDYKKEADATDNAAISTDGGASWTLVKGLGGFRSAAAFLPSRGGVAIAVGPSGSDISPDGGRTWQPIEGPGFHTLSVAPRSRSAWAAGEKGLVARLGF
jgi:photosystem II stability/assembly factor-like uncharacterized protein